jgi:hypothetical protein
VRARLRPLPNRNFRAANLVAPNARSFISDARERRIVTALGRSSALASVEGRVQDTTRDNKGRGKRFRSRTRLKLGHWCWQRICSALCEGDETRVWGPA